MYLLTFLYQIWIYVKPFQPLVYSFICVQYTMYIHVHLLFQNAHINNRPVCTCTVHTISYNRPVCTCTVHTISYNRPVCTCTLAHYFRTHTQIKHTSNTYLQIFTENVRKLQFYPPSLCVWIKKTASLGFFNYECSHFCFIVSFIQAQ